MNKRTAVGLLIALCATPFIVLAQRDIACSLTATPSRAAPGEQITLRWNSLHARSATLVGFGPVPLSGSRVIQATQTTDYKIMISGYENNYVGCIARVTVTAKQPTCNISLVPFAVASNNFATLSWTTDYADSVYISGIGNVPPKGNQMVRAVGNTTYYITARGAGGLCERSAELSVRDQYQSYGYFPQTVQNIAYPLFGYSAPRSGPNYSSSQDPYRTFNSYETYWYEDDDNDDSYEETFYAPAWENSSSETYISNYENYDNSQNEQYLNYQQPQYQEYQNQQYEQTEQYNDPYWSQEPYYPPPQQEEYWDI